MFHDAFGVFWRPLVKLVSKTTGRPSWYYVPTALGLGLGAGLTKDVLMGLEGGIWKGVLMTFLSLFVAILLIPTALLAREEAKRIDGSKSALMSAASHSLWVWRIIFTVNVAIMTGPAVTALIGIGDISDFFGFCSYLLYGYAVWALYFNEPGGKSVFARAKEKIKGLMQNLAPAPTPVPLPVSRVSPSAASCSTGPLSAPPSSLPSWPTTMVNPSHMATASLAIGSSRMRDSGSGSLAVGAPKERAIRLCLGCSP